MTLSHFASTLKRSWVRLNDGALNIRTAPPSPTQLHSPSWWRGQRSPQAKYEDNFIYASPDYWNLYRTVRKLRLTTNDVFYDLGCGMGRVLCVVAQNAVKQCVGVELLDPHTLFKDRKSTRLNSSHLVIS